MVVGEVVEDGMVERLRRSESVGVELCVVASGGDNDWQQIASDRLGVQSDSLIVRTRNQKEWFYSPLSLYGDIKLKQQDLRTPDCSCPIHRALATVSSGDESPNYRALTVQLRKS